ncbi:MAG: hypothetical protein SP1CHLAM54_03990 [Chlamydiia bacterium]|nr:hypothetical protein [Chlamydiia bacterium]MCH9615314.1 hypothetical protein [Chlamydiia bacterium]MCH9628364.1 hypothetical protein [Chlamydiia bacterium]
MRYTNVTVSSTLGSQGFGLVSTYEDESGWHLIEKGFTQNKYYNHLTLKKEGDGYHLFRYDLKLFLEKQGEAFVSRAGYPCGDDLYHARLKFDKERMILAYDIQGPKKDEQVTFEFYTIDPPFQIETDRLRLVSFDEMGEAFFLQMLQDPKADNLAGTKTHDEAKDKLNEYKMHFEQFGYGLCPIQEKKDGAFIGYGGICHLAHDERDPELEIGYHLLPDYRGLGYATELSKALVDYGFGVLKAPYLVGIANHDNAKSLHVLEKVGFRGAKDATYRGNPCLRMECYPNI